jgi:hypothetical protein
MNEFRFERRGKAMIEQTSNGIDGEMTFRRLSADDATGLERLAGRDSAEVPRGTVYGAIAADGSVLAAISLESRALVADPFLPTAHAASLLRVWARELGGARRRGRVGDLGIAPAGPAAAPAGC